MIDDLKKLVSELSEDELVFLLYNRHLPYFEFVGHARKLFETPQQITHL